MTRLTAPVVVPVLALVLPLALAACAPSTRPQGQLGYGTPGVNAYAADANTLQAQLDTCRGVPGPASPSQTQGLPAACAQLARTLRNQPGNRTRAD